MGKIVAGYEGGRVEYGDRAFCALGVSARTIRRAAEVARNEPTLSQLTLT